MKCPKCGKEATNTNENPNVRFDCVYVCRNSECHVVEFAISFDDEHSKVTFG